ncbi:MAG: 3-dehydroquinate synthase [Betaproteobacteria bacterium]|nr:3-dehydroquinate synthase [Betaproteobacteria bacterium]
MSSPLVVSLGSRSYPIHIGPGLLSSSLIPEGAGSRKVALITNTTLLGPYGTPLVRSLEEAGLTVETVALPDGEAHKTLDTLNLIYDALLTASLDRRSCLIALGGGVIGDMVGFAAATYQRGIPFIQIPTTLLAQVDSSVGGKTAVNHPKGKNMIGAFHQPRAVFADTDTLKTLPDREFTAGLAEVIKYALIRDPDFLRWLEDNMAALRSRDAGALTHAIRESCRNKSEVVARDEFETGERALLNLGHSFGHAIEGALGFGTWLHGEAVGVGMLMAALLSQELGHLASSDVSRIARLLRAAGLPMKLPDIPVDNLLPYMAVDKKNEGGRFRLILLRAPGAAYIEDAVSRDHLRSFLAGAPPSLASLASPA